MLLLHQPTCPHTLPPHMQASEADAARFDEVIPPQWRHRVTTEDTVNLAALSALSGIDPNRLMIEFRSVRGVELVHAAVAALVFGSALGRSSLLPLMLDEANVTREEENKLPALLWPAPIAAGRQQIKQPGVLGIE